MKNAILLFSLLLFFIHGKTQFFISGEVKDSSGEPLAGVVLHLTGTHYLIFSDSEGKFVFKNLNEGQYTLTYRLLGYEAGEKTFFVKEDANLSLVLLNKDFIQEEVQISAIRPSEEISHASTLLKRKDFEKINLGQDLPYLLNMTPSVVLSSDAGAGVGYTGFRVRGSDPTRINVTINSIPLNDAESHQTYWVDLPDFSSSVEDIQLQRGLGSSSNGAGAFGASLNLRTDNSSINPFAEFNSSAGSFQTLKTNFRMGTGMLGAKENKKNVFSFSGKASHIQSEGYIDRASSNLNSLFADGAWYHGKSLLKAVIISGKESTYQAWNGVPEDSLKTNRRMNEKTYKNETDNYKQNHYQLLWSSDAIPKINVNAALHYTRGKGYYEQYRPGETLLNYGIDTVFTGLDTIFQSDLIRQLWLDNHFYGFTFSGNFLPTRKKWLLRFGGAGNKYQGKHSGEVIWSRYSGASEIGHIFYENNAKKNEGSTFLKAEYRPSKKWLCYGDIQVRGISYSFLGYNRKLENVQQTADFFFLNPKTGIQFSPSSGKRIFASFGVGNREPNRDDFTQSSPDSRPKPERLYDTEIGFKLARKNYSFHATAYYMHYQDQLVLTGAINDVGAYIRSNIAESYRAGIELEVNFKLPLNFTFYGNSTLSRNQVIDFTEYLDDYDNGVQIMRLYKRTPIAFSPSLICAGSLEWNPLKALRLTWQSKYVGKQFLDNTGLEARSLNSFLIHDFRFSWEWNPKFVNAIRFNFLINNVLNELYEPNGYTYSFIGGGQIQTFNYYYPQAGRNFLAGLSLLF